MPNAAAAHPLKGAPEQNHRPARTELTQSHCSLPTARANRTAHRTSSGTPVPPARATARRRRSTADSGTPPEVVATGPPTRSIRSKRQHAPRLVRPFRAGCRNPTPNPARAQPVEGCPASPRRLAWWRESCRRSIRSALDLAERGVEECRLRAIPAVRRAHVTEEREGVHLEVLTTRLVVGRTNELHPTKHRVVAASGVAHGGRAYRKAERVGCDRAVPGRVVVRDALHLNAARMSTPHEPGCPRDHSGISPSPCTTKR